MASNPKPKMIFFWADTRKPLTHAELDAICYKAVLIHARPSSGCVFEVPNGKARKVIIYGADDEGAPPIPPRRSKP